MIFENKNYSKSKDNNMNKWEHFVYIVLINFEYINQLKFLLI
jgi:hypothetical protein